jgi:tetratricopeptide (TPR) repeat protein
MTIENTLKILAGTVFCGMLVSAQIPVAKQPQPKSQKEVDAIMAMQKSMQAQDLDGTVKAAEELLTKFADTEFKPVALQVVAGMYQSKGQFDKALLYAERLLEADPKNYNGMIMIATITAQQTREHDLDREEKLKKVEKMAMDARNIIKDAPKPRPDFSDDQWIGFRKDLTSQTYEAMALAAQARRKPDVAIQEYKQAVEVANNPDPATLVRLGALYNQTNQPDLAIPVLDRAAADPQAMPQVKQAAANEKAKSVAMKSKGADAAKPAADPAKPAPDPAKPAEPAKP